jgi:hypothetical protein
MGTATYKNEIQDHDNAAPHHHNDAAFDQNRIILPLPPSLADEDRFEMEVYARFMRHLRLVPGTRMDIKILSSIQFTADMMDHGDALVAKILADLGLRAPRRAFPVAFIDFVDKSMQRFAIHMGTPAPAAMALKEHWDMIGEEEALEGLRPLARILQDMDVLRA